MIFCLNLQTVLRKILNEIYYTGLMLIAASESNESTEQ